MNKYYSSFEVSVIINLSALLLLFAIFQGEKGRMLNILSIVKGKNSFFPTALKFLNSRQLGKEYEEPNWSLPTKASVL